MGRPTAFRSLMATLLFGYLAVQAGTQTFWTELAAQPVPQNAGPVPQIIYLFGRVAFAVHDEIGTTLTVGLLVIAALLNAVRFGRSLVQLPAAPAARIKKSAIAANN